MNSRTQELTYGAMLVAVFGVLLLINRQTAGLFEEVIFFVLPIPMMIFSLRYGWKDSLPVFVCMAAISIFMGTLYTIFYAVANAMLGIVLGTCLKNRWDLNQTQLLTMVLCAIINVLGSVVLASLFGINLQAEIAEMKTSVETILGGSGADLSALEAMLSVNSLMRIYIISMAFLGIVQGFIIFRLSLPILKRLRLNVPQPQPVGMYFPPAWTAYAAGAALILYFMSAVNPPQGAILQTLEQSLGLVGYMYLMVFGWIALTLLIRRYLPGKAMRFLAGILAFLPLLLLPYAVLILGFLYVLGGLHERLLS